MSRIRVRAIAHEQDLPVRLKRQLLYRAEDRTRDDAPRSEGRVEFAVRLVAGKRNRAGRGVGVAARNDLSVGLNREPLD
jgi:hypothetical protein